MKRYTYRDWRREDPEYRVTMRRLGRSWWMREFGLRKLRLVRLFHPAFGPFGWKIRTEKGMW
jgi:hypothetical protein